MKKILEELGKFLLIWITVFILGIILLLGISLLWSVIMGSLITFTLLFENLWDLIKGLIIASLLTSILSYVHVSLKI